MSTHRRHEKRRRYPRRSGTAPVFTLTVYLMIGFLLFIAMAAIIRGDLSTVSFSDENGSLSQLGQKIAEVFVKTEKGDDSIYEIIEQTYLGQAISVSAETDNPFEEACVPVSGEISSTFGYRHDPFTGMTALHRGIDIIVPEGTEVAAVTDGTVSETGSTATGGLYIKILHDNGFTSYYGHLQSICVEVGRQVKQGEIIALSGDTGKTTGAHLHFQLVFANRAVDPMQYFNFNAE